ncbi:MAG: hypothetical protein D6679_04045 [Candidatus Hydrogenedentota bacterium]|nr:MAG: hypothetical protein D6679_04045 [Candidatus Hydrogenedentota bacterium]
MIHRGIFSSGSSFVLLGCLLSRSCFISTVTTSEILEIQGGREPDETASGISPSHRRYKPNRSSLVSLETTV